MSALTDPGVYSVFIENTACCTVPNNEPTVQVSDTTEAQ